MSSPSSWMQTLCKFMLVSICTTLFVYVNMKLSRRFGSSTTCDGNFTNLKTGKHQNGNREKIFFMLKDIKSNHHHQKFPILCAAFRCWIVLWLCDQPIKTESVAMESKPVAEIKLTCRWAMILHRDGIFHENPIKLKLFDLLFFYYRVKFSFSKKANWHFVWKPCPHSNPLLDDPLRSQF